MQCVSVQKISIVQFGKQSAQHKAKRSDVRSAVPAELACALHEAALETSHAPRMSRLASASEHAADMSYMSHVVDPFRGTAFDLRCKVCRGGQNILHWLEHGRY